ILFVQSTDVGEQSHFRKEDLGGNRLESVHSAADILVKLQPAPKKGPYTAVVINNLDAFRHDQTNLVIRRLLESQLTVIASVVDITGHGVYPDNARDALLMASVVVKTDTDNPRLGRPTAN